MREKCIKEKEKKKRRKSQSTRRAASKVAALGRLSRDWAGSRHLFLELLRFCGRHNFSLLNLHQHLRMRDADKESFTATISGCSMTSWRLHPAIGKQDMTAWAHLVSMERRVMSCHVMSWPCASPLSFGCLFTYAKSCDTYPRFAYTSPLSMRKSVNYIFIVRCGR